MDRHWLLTWTTYGTWLPGDPRGSVTSVRDGPGPRVEHDQPGTPYDAEMAGLRSKARALMKAEPIWLTQEQAEVLCDQFQETAVYRKWRLRGLAIMANHCHLVVTVPNDPNPEKVIGDFKSYGSRALNRRWGKPCHGSWWSGGSGSKRKLPDERALCAALVYVRNQRQPRVVWLENPSASRGASSASRGASAPGGPEALNNDITCNDLFE